MEARDTFVLAPLPPWDPPTYRRDGTILYKFGAVLPCGECGQNLLEWVDLWGDGVAVMRRATGGWLCYDCTQRLAPKLLRLVWLLSAVIQYADAVAHCSRGNQWLSCNGDLVLESAREYAAAQRGQELPPIRPVPPPST